MTVALSEFTAHPGKYFELAKEDEILVTKRGDSTWQLKIVEYREPWSNNDDVFDDEHEEVMRRRHEAFLRIKELAENGPHLPPEYDDPNYDPYYDLLKEERLRKKGLIE